MISSFQLLEINRHIKDNYDLFICTSSFEDRCLSIAGSIDCARFKAACILYNEEFSLVTSENTDKLVGLFHDKSIKVKTSLNDPLLTADNLYKMLDGLSMEGALNSIFIDVTTFTHEGLLILMRILRNYYPKTRIICAYNNAGVYDKPCENIDVKDDDLSDLADEVYLDRKWLSKGVGDIRSVLGYSGNLLPTQKNHLIIIVGYEVERAISMINIMEPNSLALGYGLPSNAVTEKNKEANEHYMQIVKKMASSYEVDVFNIMCDDPFETSNELQKQIDKYRGNNIILVPMNNKISTVGAALAAMKNDYVQLCYAPALKYNVSNYSTPGAKCYLFELDFAK